MPNTTITHSSNTLCDPAWHQARFSSDVGHDITCDVAVASQQRSALGCATRDEFSQLVSSTFHKTLENALPSPACSDTTPAVPGGGWFWEVYRHALFGENVVVDLSGTGASLAEDAVAYQTQLRSHLCSSSAPLTSEAQQRVAHATSKLEVMYALALSVSLHLAKLPVLERAQGPQALVLCATHSQCSEFVAILSHFCASLHLAVHNLFDGYPVLPAGKLADVVVGTPPLWVSVSQVAAASTGITPEDVAHSGGLEDLLVDLRDEGQVPPAYSMSRWRPYKLTAVAQLVYFDVELQVNMGFGPILQHLLPQRSAAVDQIKPGRAAGKGMRLPSSCQLYAVLGGDRWRADQDAVERILSAVGESGRTPASTGTAMISLLMTEPLTCVGAARKRQRDTDEDSQVQCTGSSGSAAETGAESHHLCVATAPHSELLSTAPPQTAAFDGLFVCNALSHSRLLLDFEALTDLTHRLTEEIEGFWRSFDGSDEGSGIDSCSTAHLVPSRSAISALECVQVKLALICAGANSSHRSDDGARSCVKRRTVFRAQQLGIWLHSSSSVSNQYASRLKLLYRHIFDRVNGDLFDGSVVQCILAEDAPCHPFTLRPLAPSSTAPQPLILGSCFSYGELGIRPVLLEMAAKTSEGACEAEDLRARQRCDVAASSDRKAAPVGGMSGSVPVTSFLSADNSTGSSASFKSRLPPKPTDVCTVAVVRHLPLTREKACQTPTLPESSATDEGGKALVLGIIEECCQYGRVLSYHVHEDSLSLPTSDLQQTDKSHDSQNATSSLASHGDVCQTVVSVFVEFANPDSAAEATRQFAQRFALQAQQSKGSRGNTPRARLFRNDTYYAGVGQDTTLVGQAHGREDFGDADSDGFFEDLMTGSLLAE